jgi:hypothetical protein
MGILMARTLRGWMVAVLVAAGLAGGCSETLPLANLPGLAKLPGKVMTQEEQEKAMNQMSEKGQTQPAEAVKEIEKSK